MAFNPWASVLVDKQAVYYEWSVYFPEVKVKRGGITFSQAEAGSPPPEKRLPWQMRDADIKIQSELEFDL